MAEIFDLRDKARQWLTQFLIPRDVSVEGVMNTGVAKAALGASLAPLLPGVGAAQDLVNNTSLGRQAKTGLSALWDAPVSQDIRRNLDTMLNATGPSSDDLMTGLGKGLSHVDELSPLMGIVSAPTLQRYWDDLLGPNTIEKMLRGQASGYRAVGNDADNLISGGRNAIEDALNNPTLKAPVGTDEWEWLTSIARKGLDKAAGGVNRKIVNVDAEDAEGATLKGLENLPSAARTPEQSMLAEEVIDPKGRAKAIQAATLDDIILNPRVRAMMGAASNNAKSIGDFERVFNEQGQPIARSTAQYIRDNDMRSLILDPITKPIQQGRPLHELNMTQLSERAHALKKVASEVVPTLKGSGKASGPPKYRLAFDPKAVASEMVEAGEVSPEIAKLIPDLFKPSSNLTDVARKLDKGDKAKRQATLVYLNELMEKTLYRLKGRK